jgi:hypothetical protein
MLDIPFSSRYQAEMKKELFIDGVPELLLLRLLGDVLKVRNCHGSKNHQFLLRR